MSILHVIIQHLESFSKLDTDLQTLLEELADSISCVADVKQFVKQNHLKSALDELAPLVSDTANFVREFSPASHRTSIVVCIADLEMTSRVRTP